VAFSLAATLLLVVVGLIVADLPNSDVPPEPVAVVSDIVERGGRFVVAVDVENKGVQTAEQVQVVARLTTEGSEAEGDQMVDFLAGGEVEQLEFVFDDDPEGGELEVRVSGYLLP
jgi:uncharacterized protein (TIGR02588 family)